MLSQYRFCQYCHSCWQQRKGQKEHENPAQNFGQKLGHLELLPGDYLGITWECHEFAVCALCGSLAKGKQSLCYTLIYRATRKDYLLIYPKHNLNVACPYETGVSYKQLMFITKCCISFSFKLLRQYFNAMSQWNASSNLEIHPIRNVIYFQVEWNVDLDQSNRSDWIGLLKVGHGLACTSPWRIPLTLASTHIPSPQLLGQDTHDVALTASMTHESMIKYSFEWFEPFCSHNLIE